MRLRMLIFGCLQNLLQRVLQELDRYIRLHWHHLRSLNLDSNLRRFNRFAVFRAVYASFR